MPITLFLPITCLQHAYKYQTVYQQIPFCKKTNFFELELHNIENSTDRTYNPDPRHIIKRSPSDPVTKY